MRIRPRHADGRPKDVWSCHVGPGRLWWGFSAARRTFTVSLRSFLDAAGRLSFEQCAWDSFLISSREFVFEVYGRKGSIAYPLLLRASFCKTSLCCQLQCQWNLTITNVSLVTCITSTIIFYLIVFLLMLLFFLIFYFTCRFAAKGSNSGLVCPRRTHKQVVRGEEH